MNYGSLEVDYEWHLRSKCIRVCRSIINLYIRAACAHEDACEVDPTPGVREVLLEAVREPLEQHFGRENHVERLVRVLENVLQERLLRQINIVERLHIALRMTLETE